MTPPSEPMTLPPRPDPRLERLMIDSIRVLAMDAVQKADSGHPGTPMALAPLAYALWTRHLKHNPDNPRWTDRDRFVLSCGHASMLLYSLLHLTGYDLALDELIHFRQWGSRTPGHPEVHLTPGVETTTGPLGQGVANSVGMAMAERWLANRFNRPGHTVVDHRTWVICSDGDLMEGISHEAAELAGHHQLDKLVWLFDDNLITIEGDTDLASSTDQEKRFEGYGWRVLRVADGNDVAALDAALRAAAAPGDRPTLVIVRTVIGWGSPNKAGHHSAHGAALGVDEVRATKQALGYPSLEPFHLDPDAVRGWRGARTRGADLEAEWRTRLASYRAAHPAEAAELERIAAGRLPAGWDAALPDLRGKADATRSSSGKVIQALAARIPELIGGSADLGSSTKTDIDGAGSFLPGTPGGRTLHFGVREHGMGAILNGMVLHGGIRPYGGTFLQFADYMRPSIRLAALSELPVTFVFTHDSIGLGEDGPTHQPIEHLMALRTIPNLMDLRPADPAETVEAWRAALGRTDGPAFLALTRQKVADLRTAGAAGADGLHRGGYVLLEASGDGPEAIIMGSGSEVQLAVEARAVLEADGIPTRVVSLPSWHLFARQDDAYRASVLPPEVTARVAVEAGVTLGWERWTGAAGRVVGLDRFGASAPYEVLYEKTGITAARVAAAARELALAAREAAPHVTR
ncbi:MAG: transketolase [Gemmatimonadetes bacterium]|nr:transketolase [Gemmatimonadota bacterium]